MSYLLSHIDDCNGLITMCAVFCITSPAAVALRFYARRINKLRLQADDWLIAVSSLFVLGLNGMFLDACVEHLVTGHNPIMDPWSADKSKQHSVEKYEHAFQILEKIAFGLIKLSVLFLWRRIFGHVRWFHIMSWTMIGVIIAWMIAFFFATTFQCGANWNLNWAPLSEFLTHCSNTKSQLVAFTATDVLTDLIIIAMPLPMLWSLQIGMRKKLAVIAMFLVGFLTIGAGITRMVAYIVTSHSRQQNLNFIQDVTIFLLWSIIELNIGIICACLPTLLPVITSLSRRFSSYTASRKCTRTSRLSRSWPRLHNSPKLVGDDDSRSRESFQRLHNSSFDADTKRYGPIMETHISSVPQDDMDLEMQPRGKRDILVQNQVSHHNAAIG